MYTKAVLCVHKPGACIGDSIVKLGKFSNTPKSLLDAYIAGMYDKYSLALKAHDFKLQSFTVMPSDADCANAVFIKRGTHRHSESSFTILARFK